MTVVASECVANERRIKNIFASVLVSFLSVADSPAFPDRSVRDRRLLAFGEPHCNAARDLIHSYTPSTGVSIRHHSTSIYRYGRIPVNIELNK